MSSQKTRVALVTGGSRGIGRAIALLLAREGVSVAIGARGVDGLSATAEEIRSAGASVLAIPCDVGVRASVETMVHCVREELGPVDILVNSAGIAMGAKTVDMSDEHWESHLRVNLSGTYYCIRAVLKGMLAQGWGRIINVASTAGRMGYRYSAAYCASKHGVVGLTRALALEVAEDGVTVNAICPGFVETGLTKENAAQIARATGRTREEALASLAALSPQKRLISPEEVAALVLMLIKEEAKGITGQALQVDGGALVA